FKVLEMPARAARVGGQSSNRSSSITIIWVSGPYLEMAMDLPGPSSRCNFKSGQSGRIQNVQTHRRIEKGSGDVQLDLGCDRNSSIIVFDKEESEGKTHYNVDLLLLRPSMDDDKRLMSRLPILIRVSSLMPDIVTEFGPDEETVRL
ncbi:hypothetical protein Tco_0927832, partial [Tanacetum coccineum]